ncbi:phosphodiester glycosidase family protein [Aneurinibacillus migulanus]|uniref:phosphodiester glycosidase family protein n=1 Tax=Aneurinibacillus migulanus TaxID=47500 RepID=UPI002E1CEE9D|nr:phosphodiester glycosidase family protein [Aneurinibacillus migulanus]
MKYWKENSLHLVQIPNSMRMELVPCLPEGELLIHTYARLKKEGRELPILLMNANFFHLDGGYSISGMKYSDGTIIERSLGGYFVYCDPSGEVRIDTKQGKRIGDFAGMRWALESSPLLLPNMEASAHMEATIASEEHPRTAIGIAEDSVILAVTNGRPAGLTCRKLADMLRQAGCHTALNLDGGRSSQLVVEGKQVNRQWLRRKVYAALAIYS